MLKIRITSPLPDVLRVQASISRVRSRAKSNSRSIIRCKRTDTELTETETEAELRQGPNRLRVTKTTPFQMFFEDGAGKALTGPSTGKIGLMELRGEPESHLMQRLPLGVNEQIYGLGERFGPVVHNGQDVEIWNEDGGTGSELSYKNIPFYLSSRGYGLFVNSPGKVDFAIGTERVASVQFSLPGEELDYYVFGGPTPKDVLTQYTALTGRAPAAARVVVRPMADDFVYDGVQREDRHGADRRDVRARHPPGRLPLRLLLDEGAAVGGLRLG